MADEGYNATKLAAYTAKINSLDSAIDDQHEAIKIRDNAVNDRIVLGNHLYSLLVVLATKGKLCWIDVNEALYNDYIIYQSSHSPAQVVEGEVPGNGAVQFWRWTARRLLSAEVIKPVDSQAGHAIDQPDED